MDISLRTNRREDCMVASQGRYAFDNAFIMYMNTMQTLCFADVNLVQICYHGFVAQINNKLILHATYVGLHEEKNLFNRTLHAVTRSVDK
jgi:hypothetical protein